jgi:Protein of unknown function (DUF1488)
MTGPARRQEPPMSSAWRSDLDSFSFRPQGHDGYCVVHRRAFQTLLGFKPAPEDCAACFAQRRAAFEQAAAAKIARGTLRPDANFHLTSRDVMRACSALLAQGPGEPQ